MPQRFRIACWALLSALLLPSANPAHAASPAGAWKGQWSSQTTGHRGPLRARIRQLDEDTYRAWFIGRFAGVVPFAYPATLHRVPGTWHDYRSAQRLPLMGRYQMSATITSRQFDARFRSREDTGRFYMVRRRLQR